MKSIAPNTYFSKAVKRRRYPKAGRDERMNRLSGGLEFHGFGHADVVIEAVPEILGLKQDMVLQIEAQSNKEAIFATNTSSLPITEIAAKAKYPERVIGMHFFSPVEKMPLVELIVTEHTSPEVTKTVSKLARKMGKHVIIVNDCAGFYTTRALAPYLTEAMFMLLEGFDALDIDQAAMEAGFPVGPITLLDEVGIDVGAKYEIYLLMNELARQGKAIIMISSELPEILGMSDRILVMHEGNVAACLVNEGVSQEEVMKLATGTKEAVTV